jgi:hypothetical protein
VTAAGERVTGVGERVKQVANWAFRSRDNGRITIVQWPNISLAIVIMCDLARALLHTRGGVDEVLHWTGSAALVWWSLDEIIRGANPFRRVLGVVVLARLIIRIADPGSALG